MKKLISGPYGVLLTPFKDNKVDFVNLKKELDYVNDDGIKGFVLNGSTSEFINLSIDEQIEIIKFVSLNKAKNKEMIVGASASNAVDSIKIAEKAYEYSAKALLVCPPYYFKYTESEKEKYYLDIANNSKVPLILYNIPFFTQEIELSLVDKLFKHPNIIGIKDSSANMKRIMHLLSKYKDTNKIILTGTDDILVPALAAGVDGSFTALSIVYPHKISKLYELMDKGLIKEALEVQMSFMEDLRIADSMTFPFGYKRLMEKASNIKFNDKEIN